MEALQHLDGVRNGLRIERAVREDALAEARDFSVLMQHSQLAARKASDAQPYGVRANIDGCKNWHGLGEASEAKAKREEEAHPSEAGGHALSSFRSGGRSRTFLGRGFWRTLEKLVSDFGRDADGSGELRADNVFEDRDQR